MFPKRRVIKRFVIIKRKLLQAFGLNTETKRRGARKVLRTLIVIVLMAYRIYRVLSFFSYLLGDV